MVEGVEGKGSTYLPEISKDPERNTAENIFLPLCS